MNIMKTKVYFLGLSLLALAGCSESEVTDRPEPTPGAEVRFGVSLDNSGTRTIYGEENSNKFPIYWVQDDQVLVTSPDCMTGRQTGTYKISVKEEDQNYANSMTKVGDAGVQWGEAAYASFYSVYPADKGSVAGNGKFNLTMPDVQRMIVKAPESGNVLKCYPDMDACFMTAKKTGVANGDDVLLHYTPLSTAVRFTLKASSQVKTSLTVTRIMLKAYDASGKAMPITGDFALDLTGDSPVVTVGTVGTATSNEVVLYSYYENGAYLTLTPGQSVELNAFLIPHDKLEVNGNWILEVTTSNNETYSISLKGNITNVNGNKLVAGKIHRIGNLTALKAEETWDASRWMEYIPRNVYISEISVPGSWNSLNVDHQQVSNSEEASLLSEVQSEYDAGIRAFHLDSRWGASRGWGYTKTGLSLACGGKSGYLTSNTYEISGKKVMKDGVISFSTALEAIVKNVKPAEYMIVFCSFAQNSYDGFGDGESWMEAVSAACDNITHAENVFDASQMTAKTVVDDVLNHVIVIINCEKDPKTIESDLPTSSKCLFTYTPMVLDENVYKENSYNSGKIYKISNSKLVESGLDMHSTQAQIMATLDATVGVSADKTDNRGYGPTVDERKAKSINILNDSRDNYANGTVANLLYYHGLGGYSNGYDNQSAVASTFNPWIDGIVTNMSATPTGDQTIYYPVGVVLMNKVLDYKTVVQHILELNNKYHKAYDPNRSPLGSTVIESAAKGYSAGMVDTKINAISWEE